MGRASFFATAEACDAGGSAVAALVRLLAESGLKPHRIEAVLRNTSTPANLDRLGDVYAQACAPGPARHSRAG